MTPKSIPILRFRITGRQIVGEDDPTVGRMPQQRRADAVYVAQQPGRQHAFRLAVGRNAAIAQRHQPVAKVGGEVEVVQRHDDRATGAGALPQQVQNEQLGMDIDSIEMARVWKVARSGASSIAPIRTLSAPAVRNLLDQVERQVENECAGLSLRQFILKNSRQPP